VERFPAIIPGAIMVVSRNLTHQLRYTCAARMPLEDGRRADAASMAVHAGSLEI
jgi:hypothetical protein